jgi:NDP-sugar pyrophosphorylase family protein
MPTSSPAVILAGGQGERLRPYTFQLPKALLPIANSTILEILLRQLSAQGFGRVFLAVSHLSELIEDVCGDGADFGLETRYSKEPSPLGTAGPLRLIDGLDQPFVAINGDLLTDLNFRALLEAHEQWGAAATLAVHEHVSKSPFGIVEAGQDSLLIDYREKPISKSFLAMGVTALSPEAIGFIGPDEALSMPQLLLRLRDAGKRVCVYPTDCLWQDIGVPETYETIAAFVEEHRETFSPFIP